MARKAASRYASKDSIERRSPEDSCYSGTESAENLSGGNSKEFQELSFIKSNKNAKDVNQSKISKRFK